MLNVNVRSFHSILSIFFFHTILIKLQNQAYLAGLGPHPAGPHNSKPPQAGGSGPSGEEVLCSGRGATAAGSLSVLCAFTDRLSRALERPGDGTGRGRAVPERRLGGCPGGGRTGHRNYTEEGPEEGTAMVGPQTEK